MLSVCVLCINRVSISRIHGEKSVSMLIGHPAAEDRGCSNGRIRRSPYWETGSRLVETMWVCISHEPQLLWTVFTLCISIWWDWDSESCLRKTLWIPYLVVEHRFCHCVFLLKGNLGVILFLDHDLQKALNVILELRCRIFCVGAHLREALLGLASFGSAAFVLVPPVCLTFYGWFVHVVRASILSFIESPFVFINWVRIEILS